MFEVLLEIRPSTRSNGCCAVQCRRRLPKNHAGHEWENASPEAGLDVRQVSQNSRALFAFFQMRVNFLGRRTVQPVPDESTQLTQVLGTNGVFRMRDVVLQVVPAQAFPRPTDQ